MKAPKPGWARHIKPEEFNELEEFIPDDLRYEYYAPTKEFKILELPSAQHEHCLVYFDKALTKTLDSYGSSNRYFNGRTTTVDCFDDFFQNCRKQPGICFFKVNKNDPPNDKGFPQLVVEAGLTQNEADLRRAATQWLTGSSREVGVVVLFKIHRGTAAKQHRTENGDLILHLNENGDWIQPPSENFKETLQDKQDTYALRGLFHKGYKIIGEHTVRAEIVILDEKTNTPVSIFDKFIVERGPNSESHVYLEKIPIPIKPIQLDIPADHPDCIKLDVPGGQLDCIEIPIGDIAELWREVLDKEGKRMINKAVVYAKKKPEAEAEAEVKAKAEAKAGTP